MANINCKKCGKEIDSEYQLCPFCGESVNAEPAEPTELVEEAVDELKSVEEEQIHELKSVEEEQIHEVEESPKEEQISEDTSSKKKLYGKKKTIIIVSSIVLAIALVIGGFFVYKKVIKPERDYTAAKMLMDDNKYDKAQEILTKLGDYKDSSDLIQECEYQQAVSFYEKKDYKSAMEIFSKMYTYSDSKKYVYLMFLDVAGENYLEKNVKASKYFLSYISDEIDSLIQYAEDVEAGLRKKGDWSSNARNSNRKNMMTEKSDIVDIRERFGGIFNVKVQDCNDTDLTEAYDAFTSFHETSCNMFSACDDYVRDLQNNSADELEEDIKNYKEKRNSYLKTIDKLNEVAGLDINYTEKYKLTDNENESENGDKTKSDANKETEKSSDKKTESPTKEESYYENDTFEVTYRTLYNDVLHNSTIIHKVHASKTKDVEATVIAYDVSGNVIGKSTDEIALVEGQNNYFKFYFPTDVSNATFEVKVDIKEPSNLRGTEDAVELVTYSSESYEIFLTFKQVKPTVGSFSRFKILYIKNGEVVGDDDGYYSVYAKNLNGEGSTDVAKLLLECYDYDYIEYFFEP